METRPALITEVTSHLDCGE